MLLARAKDLATPLVQLIGIDLVRLREAGNGAARLAGLFDQLAFEFGGEGTSFEHGCVRLCKFRRSARPAQDGVPRTLTLMV